MSNATSGSVEELAECSWQLPRNGLIVQGKANAVAKTCGEETWTSPGDVTEHGGVFTEN